MGALNGGIGVSAESKWLTREVYFGFADLATEYGRLFDEKAIAVLATLPSREVLLSQVLSVFIAPMTQFLAAIDATLRLPAVMADVLEKERQKQTTS